MIIIIVVVVDDDDVVAAAVVVVIIIIRDFWSFSVCPSNKHCPSARCAYAANVVRKDLDIFRVGAVSLSHIL
jgi:hypothetical protein